MTVNSAHWPINGYLDAERRWPNGLTPEERGALAVARAEAEISTRGLSHE